MRVAWLVLLVACGRSEVDRERAAKLFKEIAVKTAPGLSGLAVDDGDGIWTIAERDARAYRITLDAHDKPTIETLVVEGIPPKTDLEGIAWLGPDKFALGTEGKIDGLATVLLADRRGQSLVVTRTIDLPEERIGIRLPSNHGAEGVCGQGDTIIVAIEAVGTADGRRFAPIVRIQNHEIAQIHRMWLTTKVGKVSALDCTIGPDGTAKVIAIERHFTVTKILEFTLPTTEGDITPAEVLDLGSVLNSRLNVEGIAVTKTGRIAAVVDNQWKTLQGPSVLVLFHPGVVKVWQ